jgi:uncharacterized protein (DUF1015 family)
VAEIYPFRGWHYDFEVAGEPSQLLAPPYDVIGQPEAETMRQSSPWHIAHLILGLPPERGAHPPVVYERAAERTADFRNAGIIRQDDEPCLYRLTQECRGPDGRDHSRHGLVCAVRLHEFAEGIVLPHEQTFPKPVEDRLMLARATRMSFSHIFSLFDDPSGTIRPCVDAAAGQPLWTMEDAKGVRHSVARIADADAIATITEALGPLRIFIADGHHRYTAALALWREEGCPLPDDPQHGALGCVTMCIADMSDPDLGLFATHRLFLRPDSIDVSRLPAGVQCQALPKATPADDLGAMLQSARAQGTPAWVFATRTELAFVRVEDGSKVDTLIDPSRHPTSRGLDLPILHEAILPALFGNEAHVAEDEENIAFLPDASEAIEAVDKGEAGLAVLTNPPSVEQLRAVCEAGETMPHKSTYFYPKVPSGAVMRSLRGGTTDV